MIIPIAIISLICFVVGLIKLPKTPKTLSIAFASFVCFTLVLFVYFALWLGCNIQADAGMAGLFMVFLLPIFFPPLVAAGFLLRWIAEFLIRRKIPGRNLLPWIIPMAFCLPGIAAEISHHSTASVFHDYVSDDMPKSLSDFQYYWYQVPGDHEFIVSFKLDPSEFGKILSRHKFEETSGQPDIHQALDQSLKEVEARRDSGCNMVLPKTAIVRMYHYSEIDNNGEPHLMDVFANDSRDTVIIFGDN